MKRFTRAALAAAIVCALHGAAQAQTILRWGDVVGGSHPQVQMIDRVAAEVKAKTGGRVEIQSFAGGQIGGSRDMIEAVAKSALRSASSQMGRTIIAGGLNSSTIPMLCSVMQPFGIDISTGIEDKPGIKNINKMHAIIQTIKELDYDISR